MRRLTPNQVVAYNLRRARERKGWTQDEAAERLEPFLGERWSKATWSSAERSAERDDRRRQFTADNLFAFTMGFGLDLKWFLQPPEGVTVVVGRETWAAAPDWRRDIEDAVVKVNEALTGLHMAAGTAVPSDWPTAEEDEGEGSIP